MKKSNTNGALFGVFYAFALIAILGLSALVFLGCYYLTSGSLWMSTVFTLVALASLVACVWAMPFLRQRGYSAGVQSLIVILFLILFAACLVPHNHFWRIMENRHTLHSMFKHSIDESQAIFAEYDAYATKRMNAEGLTPAAKRVLKTQLHPASLEGLRKDVDAFVDRVHGRYYMYLNPMLMGNIDGLIKTIEWRWAGELIHCSEPVLKSEAKTVKPFAAEKALEYPITQLKLIQLICTADNFEFFIQAGMLSYWRIGENVLLLLLLLMPYFVSRKEEDEVVSDQGNQPCGEPTEKTVKNPFLYDLPETPVVEPIGEPVVIPEVKEIPLIEPVVAAPAVSDLGNQPSSEPEPIAETEPAPVPEPAVEPEPVVVPEPAPEPIVEPEPVVIPEIPVVEPIVIPEIPVVEPIVIPEIPVVEPIVIPEIPVVEPVVIPEIPVVEPVVIPEIPVVEPIVLPEIPTVEPITVPTVEPITIPTPEPAKPAKAEKKAAPSWFERFKKPKTEAEKQQRRRAALSNIFSEEYLQELEAEDARRALQADNE